jgi:hypothetical protein
MMVMAVAEVAGAAPGQLHDQQQALCQQQVVYKASAHAASLHWLTLMQQQRPGKDQENEEENEQQQQQPWPGVTTSALPS